jgi:ribonucleoside-diphosphate reductase alpha chain
LDEDVRDSIRHFGLRNVTLLTVAPTGTTGTMVNASTGIEPYFSLSWTRKSRLGEHTEFAAPYKEWMDAGNIGTLPDYFVTAMMLTPMEHVRMQAAAQKYIDTSISKTVNVPNEFTIEQTNELYMAMYDLGCKGGTIYRDGSRFEQVLHVNTPEEKTLIKIGEDFFLPLEQLTCPECGEEVDDSTCDIPCKHCNFMGCAV